MIKDALDIFAKRVMDFLFYIGVFTFTVALSIFYGMLQ